MIVLSVIELFPTLLCFSAGPKDDPNLCSSFLEVGGVGPLFARLGPCHDATTMVRQRLRYDVSAVTSHAT